MVSSDKELRRAEQLRIKNAAIEHWKELAHGRGDVIERLEKRLAYANAELERLSAVEHDLEQDQDELAELRGALAIVEPLVPALRWIAALRKVVRA
jgi:hypothetical protein